MRARLDIRRAARADLPAVLALYQHLNEGDRAPPLDIAADRLDAIHRIPGSAVWIGAIGHDLIASCTLIVIPNLTRAGQPYGLIENVVTHADHRGLGYGKDILRAAVDAAWDADCYKVMLMTGSKKASTLAFYAAAGFEQSKTGFQVRRVPVRAET